MKRWQILYVASAVTASAIIAHSVRKGHTAEFDKAITRAMQTRRGPRFRKLMWGASWAGFPPQSRTIPMVLPIGWLAAGKLPEAGFQLAGWGTSLISGTVKQLMRRPRPNKDEFNVVVANIGGTSFPSGHVINYTGVYGTLGVLIHYNVRNTVLRRTMLTAIGAKLALVGPSRIYLGHHWFTDVLTSYLLGSSWVIVLANLYQRRRRLI